MTESRVLKFGSFELIPGRRTLVKEGLRQAMGPRAFDLLLALLGLPKPAEMTGENLVITG